MWALGAYRAPADGPLPMNIEATLNRLSRLKEYRGRAREVGREMVAEREGMEGRDREVNWIKAHYVHV